MPNRQRSHRERTWIHQPLARTTPMTFRQRRPPAFFTLFVACALPMIAADTCRADDDHPSSAFRFPTVPAEHRHVRLLLENALRYAAPEHHLIDASSGYPVEGWNHDPKGGLYLRSFTQLTAVGQWLELLANIVSGHAETPFLSRDAALEKLNNLVRNLRADQHNPRLSAEGLLSNFLDLATGQRLGPLASDVDKRKFAEAFGAEKGESIWKALIAKGWIAPRNEDREAEVHRIDKFGYDYFDGPLAPFADEPTRQKVLAILDQRVVMAVFGDNANLSASVAKAIGALLHPAVRDMPGIAAPRRELEQFLEDQRAGYTRLYDVRAGLFNFGWDATRDRLFGWEDLQGKWTTGHIDYFVNEFRAPATFVVLRYGLPVEAIGNLGIKFKSYAMPDGRRLYALAPWEGSAFQAMGLGVWLGEVNRPGWRRLLDNVVAIEVDYATRHGLPGFLSESYTGNGTQYTGSVGIPAITVVPRPRLTDAASLYTLGAAYTIAPERVEKFLAANWDAVSRTFTDHGPWEGYNVTRHEVIPFQTTAHTLALVLGLLRTGSEHMARYVESKGLAGRLAELFPAPGGPVDLLSDAADAFAWTDKESRHQSRRENEAFHVQSDLVHFLGIALMAKASHGVNLSGGRLRVRYRSTGAIEPVTIALKPVVNPQAAGLIAKEIFTRFEPTKDGEAVIEVPLPEMPGLTQVKEIVFSYEPGASGRPVDVTLTSVECLP
jgi:hypothetical protein